MSKSAQRHKILADEVRGILSDSLPLSESTMHYIDSTFSDPTAAELKAILADDSNCERDPLLELIHTPDEALQIHIEDLLERSNFKTQDREQIVDHLMEPPTVVRMTLSRDRGKVEISLAREGARRLVGQLRVERQLAPVLVRAIEKNVDDKNRSRVKVIFRNARCRFCRRDVEFLVLLLKGLNFYLPGDIISLEYALAVLTDSPPPTDIYAELIKRKKIYTRQLQTALKRDEMLRKSNPEIMMLQGRVIGGIDTVEARRLIEIIDRICLAAYNRTEPTAAEPLEAEYDYRNREDALKFII